MCEAVALWYITGQHRPVFAGDLNNMVLVHWDSDEQQPSLHIGGSLEGAAMHAAMRALIARELQTFHSAGVVPDAIVVLLLLLTPKASLPVWPAITGISFLNI